MAPNNLAEKFGFLPRFDGPLPGESPTLDYAALNVFFRSGMFLNGATAFREIRRVSPDPTIVRATSITREAALEAYIDLFCQSVRRLAAPDSVIGLSGGADSRHILLELHAQKKLPSYAVTVAIPGRPSEPPIARTLAERLGVRHVTLTPNPAMAVRDELSANQATNYMSPGFGWLAEVGRTRSEAPYWDGIAGDVMSAGLFLEEWSLSMFEQNRLDELADRLVQSGPVPFFREQCRFPRSDALSAVRQELSKHTEAANPVGSFYFWNRTRVHIAASAFGVLCPRGQTTLAPYLDCDLWFFLAGLPARLMLDHSFHRDAIARAYPEFGALPYFEHKGAIPARDQRTIARRLLWHILSSGSLTTEKLAAAARTILSLVSRTHRDDIRWLLPTTVYCMQIQQVAALHSGRRNRESQSPQEKLPSGSDRKHAPGNRDRREQKHSPI